MPVARWRLAPDAVAVRAGQEMVVWVPATDVTHLLDAVATSIVQEVVKQPVELAVQALALQYDAPAEIVLEDVERLVHRFQQDGLLVQAPR